LIRSRPSADKPYNVVSDATEYVFLRFAAIPETLPQDKPSDRGKQLETPGWGWWDRENEVPVVKVGEASVEVFLIEQTVGPSMVFAMPVHLLENYELVKR
jgi:hypothetical protein